MNGIALADTVEILFEFANLVVNLRPWGMFADHVGKAVNLCSQIPCVFDDSSGVLQPPREHQSQNDGQKGRANP